MKTGTLIHPALLGMLASFGHTDGLLICDAGFPVPPRVPIVDLAYRPGHAPFLDVLDVVVATIHVESAVIASEASRELEVDIERTTALHVERIAHATLKARARRCRGVVRTGEYTPYANVILTASAPF